MAKYKKVNRIPYLALEERPNSFIPIDLESLDIISSLNIEKLNLKNSLDFCSIAELDYLFNNFTKEEIIESIKRSNTVTVEIESDTPLVIIYEKHKLPLLTKEENLKMLNIDAILTLVVSDSKIANVYKNKFDLLFRRYGYNQFSEEAIEDMLNVFHDTLINKDKMTLKRQFEWIQYLFKREIIIYMNEMITKEKTREQSIKRVKEGV